MSTNAVDFVAAIASNPVKNGDLIVGQQKASYGNGIAAGSGYMVNYPAISDIQSKYIEHFDDPTYYTA